MKKLALVVISLDECFPEGGYRGGGHKVTRYLIEGLIKKGEFEIDIYAKKGSAALKCAQGINSINVIGKKNFKEELKKKLDEKEYDYILSSDILLPFANNLVHSNSSRYKSKNGKSPILSKIVEFYNRGKIKAQEKNICKNKATFTVSNSLKKDYVENFNLDENLVFTAYPSTGFEGSDLPKEKHDNFTIGAIAGGGLNKGGYLLLSALSKLPKSSKIKARIIFPKYHKSGFYRLMIKLLGLSKRVELLPKQENMGEFYKTIDCYVLPSLNEAFGLVVTEAGNFYKPTIISSTTGASELYQDEVNGFIFNRSKNAVKNLRDALIKVENIYNNDYEKFIKISTGAKEISDKLSWDDFVDVIVNNMVA